MNAVVKDWNEIQTAVINAIEQARSQAIATGSASIDYDRGYAHAKRDVLIELAIAFEELERPAPIDCTMTEGRRAEELVDAVFKAMPKSWRMGLIDVQTTVPAVFRTYAPADEVGLRTAPDFSHPAVTIKFIPQSAGYGDIDAP